MSAIKPVLRFLLVALATYIILIYPWPGIHHGYRAVFMAMVHGVYGSFGDDGTVRCEPILITPKADVDLYLGKRMPEAGNRILEVPTAINARNLGYAPFVFYVSLLVATPISWGRKWRSAVWGLLLVGLFVVLRVGLVVVYWFGAPTDIRKYDFGVLSGFVAKSFEFLAISPGGTFVVSALIWVAVTWRGKDIQVVLARVLTESDTQEEPH